MIKIRDFVATDQPRARRLIESGLGEHFGFVDSSQNPDLDDIDSSYIKTGDRFFVAERDGLFVGVAGLIFVGDRARMVRVSTHPEHRRCGVAAALLDRCMETTRQAGLIRLVVYTQPEWVDATSFYARYGFEQYGKDDVDVHLGLDVVLA